VALICGPEIMMRYVLWELEARGMQVKVQVCATRLSEDRGRWTGYIVGEAPYGQAKGRATERIAAEEELDLQLCHAYGNSLLDRRMLSAVGHPHVVNPGKDLAALANQRDWPIWHWHLEKKLDSNANTAWAAGIQRVERQA
jgi:phosphoserine phosphatase